jgi:hypothetical protein
MKAQRPSLQDQSLIRRPEVPRLARELQRRNPKASPAECLHQAKVICTSKPHRTQKGQP